MADKKTKVFHYAENNNNVVRLVDTLSSPPYSKTREEIATGLGCSPSHLKNVYAAHDPCSRVMSVAAEGLLRRFNKMPVDLEKLVIARIAPDHWATIQAFITGLGGSVIEQFHALLTEGDSGDRLIVIMKIGNAHTQGLGQLVKVTGGEIRSVI